MTAKFVLIIMFWVSYIEINCAARYVLLAGFKTAYFIQERLFWSQTTVLHRSGHMSLNISCDCRD